MDNKETIYDTDIPKFDIDACKPPFIHLTGVASNCQKETGTFVLEVEQYMSCLKSSNQDPGNAKPVSTFSCYIPDSPKYKNGKPTPFNKRYVSMSGFLTDVTMQRGKPDQIESFKIEVVNIVFCGQYTLQAISASNGLQNSKCLFPAILLLEPHSYYISALKETGKYLEGTFCIQSKNPYTK